MNGAAGPIMVVLALAAAAALRLTSLDAKIYWHDETYTSLRAAGFTTAEMIDGLFDGDDAPVQEVRSYQRLKPLSRASDTLRSLATEDSEHPPLYFLAARAWMVFAGDSPRTLRTLSALIGLAAIPLVWWLARELFPSLVTAGAAVGLMAVSPFFVQYAHEARPYSLWTFGVLLSGATLFRAIRRSSARAWAVYVVSSVLGLYTHVLFLLVLAAQGGHVMTVWSQLKEGAGRKFVLSALVILVAFLPWAAVMALDFERSYEANSWMRVSTNATYLRNAWVGNVASLIVTSGTPLVEPAPVQWMAAAGILLVFAGLFVYDRRSTGFRYLAIQASIGLGALVLPDVVFGGGRSTVARYLLPFQVASLLAVARAAGLLIDSTGGGKRRAMLAGVAALILAAATVSGRDVLASRWPRDDGDRVNWDLVHRIQQGNRPLVILIAPWPTNVGDSLALSQALASADFRFLPAADDLTAIPRGRDVFVFGPTGDDRVQLERRTGRRLERASSTLWFFVPGSPTPAP